MIFRGREYGSTRQIECEVLRLSAITPEKKAKVGEGEGEVWWLGGGFQSTINEARPLD